ncbi:hypothetical protein GH714_035567 [Hevea brasiliensis]|uniref:Uncharacterized protein n=1 Tax=Hevea brasiliensis TaxID=3981 RepID=A0A6A6KY75_HEVBR|nr:hypothetical protein GH714_035567 [Hevea brasiliensis]
MTVSIEALAMAGMDYLEWGMDVQEWEREEPPPPHLLAEEEKEEEVAWNLNVACKPLQAQYGDGGEIGSDFHMTIEECDLLPPPPHLLAQGDEELKENAKLRTRSSGKLKKIVVAKAIVVSSSSPMNATQK